MQYRDLEWELEDYYSVKKYYTYDKSVARILNDGGPNARHVYPREFFGLVIDYVEKKIGVSAIYKNVVLDGDMEWFSMAFERRKEELIVYMDPQNLVHDKNSGYLVQNKLEYSNLETFNISGIPSERVINLKKFNPELIKFIYGRDFKDLPKGMGTEHSNAYISLPPEGQILPVGYTTDLGYIIRGYGARRSRWVRKLFLN